MKHLFTFLFFVSILWACQKDTVTTGPMAPTPTTPVVITPVTPTYTNGSGSVHLTLGNPSGAVDNPANLTNYLLLKKQYAASYNNATGVPNWTAWHLDKTDLGSTSRQDDFRPDATLPVGYYQVKPTDYTASDGFDRGHMCPSADRTNSIENNSATFLMTNIAPQTPQLNRGIWGELEAFCREQIYAGNEVYVYAGSYGVGGEGSKGFFNTIAGGKITVPAWYYKVIVVLPEGENDLARINENTTILVVNVPNRLYILNDDWEDYISLVATVEQGTNLSFLSAVPLAVRTKLRLKKYPIATTSAPTTATTTTPSTPSTNCGLHNGKKLYKGPEGGCYYINSNGNKTYVSRSECTC